MSRLIKIGTRGSKLALWQAYYVEERLKNAGFETEIVIINTKGDQILNTSLSKIGSKGVFTQELEDQLRTGEIDIAVHSAKDLSSELPSDLEIIAFTEREQTHDVLISFNKNINLSDNIHIGTSATRRKALLKHFYPHVITSDVRGNLQTRIEKLKNGAYDALMLAYAGVHRMGYEELIVHHFEREKFTTAVGQGSVAIEASVNIEPLVKITLVNALNDTNSSILLQIERNFLRKMNGGCSIPVFGNAIWKNTDIELRAGIVSLDGKKLIVKTETRPLVKSDTLGEDVAEAILKEGGREILEEIKLANNELKQD
jgi:hydroxymethylbilane synthase